MSEQREQDVWATDVANSYELRVSKFDELHEKILTEDDVIKITGADKSSIARWTKEGNFPFKVALGMQRDEDGADVLATGYRFSEISCWINSRPEVGMILKQTSSNLNWNGNPAPPPEIRPGRRAGKFSKLFLQLPVGESLTLKNRKTGMSVRRFACSRGMKVRQQTQSDGSVRMWKLTDGLNHE